MNIKKNAGAARERMLSNQMTGKLPWGMFKVIRRDLLEKVNVQFEGYSVGEEAIFSFEILRNAQNVKFADKVIYHYVQNSNGQHTKGDKDPWHPMVTAMKNHLQEIGEYEKYKKSLNSLALKAISIGMYRCTMNTNVTDAIKFMSNLHKEYSEEFDIKTFDKVNSYIKIHIQTHKLHIWRKAKKPSPKILEHLLLCNHHCLQTKHIFLYNASIPHF